MSVRALLLFCCLLSCKRAAWDPPAPDRSNGEIPVVSASRLSGAGVQLDGRLDEPAWKTAADTGASSTPARDSRSPAHE
jgi:hypothetical protein